MLLGRVPRSPQIEQPATNGDRYRQIPAEPYWLPEDTQLVLEYLREKALACPGCGLPRDETMDPEAHYRSRTFRCHACAAREEEARRFTSGPHKSGGLLFTAERVNGHP